MLVSHRKKFVFTKTAKTAGTSVESYYEPFCMPEGVWQESHARDEYVSDSGIIGYRGTDTSGCKFYNHMPAAEIRDLIGEAMWDDYFKFTVIRNPFTKLVSGWYHFHRPNVSSKRTLKSIVYNPFHLSFILAGKRDIVDFRSWILGGGQIIDRDKYQINEQVVVDYFIKQEEISEGIEHVNAVLGISNYDRKLPSFKAGMRNRGIPILDFFDSRTEKVVREKYAWEIEYFGYQMPTD